MRRLILAAGVAGLMLTGATQAQQIDVEEFTLDNGMKFLLYPRHEQPNIISAGWLAKVGSVNERPGITGISHFFEHMMFKGTNTIGTGDAGADRSMRVEQDVVRDQMLEIILSDQYQRWRIGEIDDPWDATNDTEELASLRAKLLDLMEQQKEGIIKDEFDQVYTQSGASGMNAFTTNDITFYFISVPSNKFELWAWMESDRLGDSVFREFYSERDVVHEERRLRTESTPTGVFQEQFDAMFWQASPYAHPVIGWTSDLNSYTLEQAQEYFDTYYQPGNLVGIIVGDFQSSEIKPVIEEYFSRLSPGTNDVPSVVTLEMPQLAEQRMYAECDCQPQVEARYKTVPFGHVDGYVLELMGDILNGRTGRLYKSLIEGKEIASSASAATSLFGPQKYGGYFSFNAQTKGDATPEQLEEGWYEEIERLQSELVGEQELQKVKNQVVANSYRQLQSNFFLLLQLGIFENTMGWREINDRPRKLLAVTAEDIQRVANTYFAKENRSVAMYTRLAGAAPADPEFQALVELVGDQMANMVRQQVKGLADVTDAGELRQALEQMAAQKAQMPPEMAPAMEYMTKKINERITELEAASEESE